MGVKTDDFSTVPLCHEHHRDLHAGDVRGYTREELQAKLDRTVTALLREALLTKLELEAWSED